MMHDSVNSELARKLPPRLLMIEDDADVAWMMQDALVSHFGEPDDYLTHCRTLEDARQLDVHTFDLVIADMQLPDGTGQEYLTWALDQRPNLPVVMVADDNILDTALKTIRAGAYDYVVKAGDYLFAIPLIVEKNLELYRTRKANQRLQSQLQATLKALGAKNNELQDAVAKLETMATTDPLTGLANRREFGRVLDRRFAEAQRYDQDLACVMIDLDGFKALNDTLGHQWGDRVLAEAARLLDDNIRDMDLAGRFGGDEFILVLPRVDEAAASIVAERVGEHFKAKTAAMCSEVGYIGTVTMSMGLATLTGSGAMTPDQLVARADEALYAAKRSGKTRLVVYRPSRAGDAA